jgi:dienelactone hydrolase
MHTADIEYTANGRTMVGQLAVDDSRTGRRPAVLVSHEGGGLDDHAKTVARRLAEAGYVAFALDYYGGGAPLPQDQVLARFSELAGDPLLTRAIGTAGLDILLADDRVDPGRVAAIGFCFGGTMSLELARGGADLAAIVGFHSGLTTSRPEDAANITAKVLVCIGSEDPYVPAAHRAAFEEEMRAAGVDWRMILLGGMVHSFTNPSADGSNPALKFDALAEARSWRAMLDLFEETFG